MFPRILENFSQINNEVTLSTQTRKMHISKTKVNIQNMFILRHVPLPFPGKFPVEQSISWISERIQKPSILNGCALYIYSSKCNQNLKLRKPPSFKTPKEIHSSQKSRKVSNLWEVCSPMVNFVASTNPNKRMREKQSNFTDQAPERIVWIRTIRRASYMDGI